MNKRNCHLIFQAFNAALITLLPLLTSLPVRSAEDTFQINFQRITLAQGLSQASVYAIQQDQRGFMWFGTQEGLNRFDGYQFQHFFADTKTSDSLSHSSIKALYLDRQGTLWIGTDGGGLNRLNPDNQSFTHYQHDPKKPTSISDNHIQVILEDTQGYLWVGTNHGLSRLNPQRTTFKNFYADPENKTTLKNNAIRALYEDSSGTLWVGTDGGGLSRLNRKQLHFTTFLADPKSSNALVDNKIRAIGAEPNATFWIGTENGMSRFKPQTGIFTNSLNSHKAQALFRDNTNTLWVGTNKGLKRWNPERNSFTSFKREATEPSSLSNNSILAIYQDLGGVLWFGTHGGLNKWNPAAVSFPHFKQVPSARSSLSDNFVNAFNETPDGQIWIATSNGLNLHNPKTNTFKVFHHQPNNPNSLSGNAVMCLSSTSEGHLWVGTQRRGACRFDPETERFERFQHNADDPNSLSGNAITTILTDRNGTTWVSVFGGSINRYDSDLNGFHQVPVEPQSPSGLVSDRIISIYEDKAGVLWLGSFGSGLIRFDVEPGIFTTYKKDATHPDSLSDSRIFSIFEDRNGSLWVGTPAGLNFWSATDRRSGLPRFKSYSKQEGLPSASVYGILSDSQDFIWVSTNRGLARFHPADESFKTFDTSHGLQSNEFNFGAAYRSKKGRLFFGGINGFNAFNPSEILDNNFQAPVQFTALFKNHEPLDKSQPLASLKRLRLTHKDYAVSFEFAALDFVSPQKNTFMYKLEGLDEDWIHSGTRHRTTYTNLAPKTYKFRVRAANNDGVWSEHSASMVLEVLPPLWLTWWAYSFYILLLLLLIFSYVRRQKQKLAQEHAKLEQEHKIVERLRAVDKLKDEFLANTSHELRTPLNGIIGIAESLVDGATGPLPEPTQYNLNMIVNSGKRLSSLISDILDFSQLKNKGIQLYTQPLDLFEQVDTVLQLSKPLLGAKELTLKNEIPSDMAPAFADQNRLQQILYNLIGNAIKFTDHGAIRVTAQVQDDTVVLCVQDTGPGIPEEKQTAIFESFEQVEVSLERAHGGVGLGLSISKRLVELHNGHIWMESTLGEGSKFFFSLPRSKQALGKSYPSGQLSVQVTALKAAEVSQTLSKPQPEPNPTTQPNENTAHILIVDDNPENRLVLRNHLSLEGYRLSEAANGQQALDHLEVDNDIDLILLDIMMPGMSGFEVCKKIRKHQNYRDINQLPIVFLTAKSQTQDLVYGFQAGGNDYLKKPFSKQELLARLRIHLRLLELSRNLEELIEERSKKLVAQEKQASLGNLTSGVAHVILNPLNFIKNHSEVVAEICEDLRDDLQRQQGLLEAETFKTVLDLLTDLDKNASTIIKHGQEMQNIVAKMTELVRTGKQESEPCDINELISLCASLACEEMRATQKGTALSPLHLKKDLAPDLPQLNLVPQEISRVLIHLFKNALEALNEKARKHGPDFSPSIFISTKQLERHIEITIKDNGTGIPQRHEDKIYNPFFTTKPAATGLHIGLGLSISHDLVRNHDGELSHVSIEDAFSEFTIKLPLTLID